MKKVLSFAILFAFLASWGMVFSQEDAEKKLSLKDAIYLALKNNLDLKVQKFQTQSTFQSLRGSRAKYLPTLSFNYDLSSQLRPATDVYDGVANVERKNTSYQLGIFQQTPFGGSFSFGFFTQRTDSNSMKERLDPGISTYAYIGLSQPLLKNFGLNAANYNIKISANNYKMSKFDLKSSIVDLVYQVESAYWELVYAHQNLDVTKMALERARDLQKQNEVKMRVGTIAPKEVLSSKAQVATNESNLIAAERVIQTNEENLKRILNLSRQQIIIVPTDTPEIKTIPVDFEKFLEEAMENRPDINKAKLSLKNQNIEVKYYKNQALPTLNLEANFSSYGGGGTVWQINPLLLPTDPNFRIMLEERTFGDAVDEMFSLENKNYAVGLNLQVPVGLKQERANLARAKINRNRSLTELENIENTIYSEVKTVIKELESNRKQVEADKIAMELESENLKAEEKKLAVGLSTNFEVLTFQQQLAQAQTRALRSSIDYNLTLAKINRILNRTFKVFGIKFSEIVDKK
jgi:outer membrane protein TolC